MLHPNIFRPGEYLPNKTRDARRNTHRWSRKMFVRTLRHAGQLISLNFPVSEPKNTQSKIIKEIAQ